MGERVVFRPYYRRLPLVVAVIGAALIGGIAFWDPLEIDEHAHVTRVTEQNAAAVRADLVADINSRVLFESRLAKVITTRPPEPAGADDLIPRVFFAHDPADIAVQWFDADYRLRWSAVREPQEPAVLAATREPDIEALLRQVAARPGSEAMFSRAFRLGDGRWAMRLVIPIAARGIPISFFVALVDVRVALEAILLDHRELGYLASVSEDGTEIFTSQGANREHERTWGHEAEVQLPGTIWRVRVWPDRDTIPEIRSRLPELALGFGALLGSLVVFSVYFARAASKSASDLQRAHDVLEGRVEERTSELRLSNEKLEEEIADRARAEESLQKLSARLLQLQDDERRRIARELHDSMGQMLGALAINLEVAERRARERGDTQLVSVLHESSQFVSQVTQEVRTLSYLLHPPMLDDLGLEYVLPWYIDGFSKRSGIAVDLTVAPGLGRFAQEIELTLFRIAQEALTNVYRHSGSRSVNLTLTREGHEATLQIRDHGRGLPASLDRDVAELGVGIAGMRERVRQFGGVFDLQTTSAGTAIRVVLPALPRAAASQDSAPV